MNWNDLVREYIDIINEAAKPKATATKTDGGFEFLNDLGVEQPVAAAKGKTKRDVKFPGKKSKSRTPTLDINDRTAQQAFGHFSDLHRSMNDQEDIIDDEQARRNAGYVGVKDVGVDEPPNIENLPAVISKEVAETGGRINPEWRQIKHLPGYMQRPIRVLGRAVFSQFTDTPIEDIQMIGTIGGLNTEREVVGMMDWIKRHGIRDDSANIDFSQIMPGYTADVALWNTDDFSFLLVRDFAGYYIYGWVDGRGFRLDTPPNVKRISDR